MRQLTDETYVDVYKKFSKLPMRQLTSFLSCRPSTFFSKLPMRQLTMTKSEVEEMLNF